MKPQPPSPVGGDRKDMGIFFFIYIIQDIYSGFGVDIGLDSEVQYHNVKVNGNSCVKIKWRAQDQDPRLPLINPQSIAIH